MLAGAWRFIIYNDTNVQLDFSSNGANEAAEVEFERAYLDPATGKARRVDGDPTTHSASIDLSAGEVEALSAVTDETALQLDGTFTVKSDNADCGGKVVLGVETSQDGGSTWPSDSPDWDPEEDLERVSAVLLDGAEEHARSIRLS